MQRRTLFSLALLLLATTFLSPGVRAQADEREKAAAEIESLREQIKAREAILLAPSNEDRQAYAEFLAQSGTGLIRLLPREKWDSKLSTRGGGAYYSFTRLTHEYGYGSDISLEQDYFQVGFAGANFGFMVNLGVVPLETVTAETDGVRFMSAFQTPSAEPEARKAYRQFGGGQKAGQWVYMNRLPVSVNSTYVVRSINYDASDVLVAFRVVRKDSDGSVVLLWKMVNQFQMPILERNTARAAEQLTPSHSAR
jgi:hypothetical protein